MAGCSSGGDSTTAPRQGAVDTTFTPHGYDSTGPATSATTTTPDETEATATSEAERLAARVPDADEREAVAAVLAAIESGEELPYDQDGSTFQNREGNLPDLSPPDYYREYTVPTPGSPDRGARRLVISSTGLVYYTSDHYETFTLLNPDG